MSLHGGQESRDEAMAASLARGQSVAKVAEMAGVNRSTVYARLRKPDFQELIATYRGEYLSQAVGVLTRISGKSAATLGKLLGSQDERVALSAANHALSHVVKLAEYADLERRLAALENKTGEQPKRIVIPDHDTRGEPTDGE